MEKSDSVLPRVMIYERASSMRERVCHECHGHWGSEFQPGPEHVYSSIKMEASALVLGFRSLISATEEKEYSVVERTLRVSTFRSFHFLQVNRVDAMVKYLRVLVLVACRWTKRAVP